VFDEVFQFVLKIAVATKLGSGKTVAVDSTTLEANAAMKTIIRRDTFEDWKEYVIRLMRQEGVIEVNAEPSDEEVRRYNKKRKNKKISNDKWVSPTDPDSRITQMKDGRAHLAYKAEHVVDLKNDLVLAAEVLPADHADTETMVDSVMQAQANLGAAGSQQPIEEAAADKGYHAAGTLELCGALQVRTYSPEPQRKHRRRWTDKPASWQRAVYTNRRRMRRPKGKQLQRRRSEFCERTFVHICNSGWMRRTRLRGLTTVSKRYLIAAAAHNLGRILRKLFKLGKPKALQPEGSYCALRLRIREGPKGWVWRLGSIRAPMSRFAA
jgi:hypothetical protein